MKRAPWIAAALLAAGAAAWVGVRACGPDTTDAHFEALSVPDTAPAEFVAGKLGILRPGFHFQDRVVAYRWLKGLSISAADQKALLAYPKEETSPDPKAWLVARASVMKDGTEPTVDPFTRMEDWSSYSRLTQGALDTAVATLADREKTHGNGPELRAWIAAQDQVFASTKGHPAIPEPVTSPAWLKADRDYQIAAALFYAERFDEARSAFAAIGKDAASPWRVWAPYLEARCLVRQVSLVPDLAQDTPPEAVEALRQRWVAIQRQIEAHLPSTSEPVDAALRSLRDLVRHRSEPGELWASDLQALATEKEGLTPLVDSARWVVLQGHNNISDAPGKGADLQAWLDVMDVNEGMKAGRPGLAFDQWKATGSKAWLVAALALWPGPGPEADALIAAAAKVPDSDPAAPTARWYALQLHLASLEGAEKRTALDAALKMDSPTWAKNSLLRQRGAVATDLADWMRVAVHEATGYGDGLEEGVEPRGGPHDDNASLPSRLFDGDEAATLNRSFTIAQLGEAAKAAGLPPALRDELARVAWLRAALLESWDQAAALAPALEPELRTKAMEVCAISDTEARRFALAKLVMAFPGLRPTVNEGLGGFRLGEKLSDFDAIRDNWWCGEGTYWQMDSAKHPIPVPEPPTFLKPEEAKAAAEEQAALGKLPAAIAWFGRIVLDHAKTHPQDAKVPDALARVVATTRSPMCEGPDISAVSREAFRLLHTAYKDTAAAKRTKYHY
ncbi:MAG TPA: hypothetical protein VFM84_07420 [Holophagaceae bacterium]|nr:hypothetical protein [Holophagaceae bacterium]